MSRSFTVKFLITTTFQRTLRSAFHPQCSAVAADSGSRLSKSHASSAPSKNTQRKNEPCSQWEEMGGREDFSPLHHKQCSLYTVRTLTEERPRSFCLCLSLCLTPRGPDIQHANRPSHLRKAASVPTPRASSLKRGYQRLCLRAEAAHRQSATRLTKLLPSHTRKHKQLTAKSCGSGKIRVEKVYFSVFRHLYRQLLLSCNIAASLTC